ncbi:MAG TPA: DUF1850 domain-containing protein [Candidatus Binatia bacterium]|nr:DUF1850 domain-containing protein [Candidatus Binatia bacterium]
MAITAFAPHVADADMCEEHAPEQVLVVEDVDGGRVVHREPVRPGDRLMLSWVHSSENVPVRGSFIVEADGSLRVHETAYAGFGPGLPAPQPGDAWQYRDGMIVTAGGAALPELRLRVSPIARQRLILPSGREVNLPELFPGGAAVRIGVR